MKKQKHRLKLNMRLSEDIQIEELFPEGSYEEEQHIRMKSHPEERKKDERNGESF